MNSVITPSRCRRPKIKRWSRHSRRAVPQNLSANEFARGARKGRRTTSTPSQRKTSSNPAVNLVSRSLSRNFLAPSSPSCSLQTRLRACWTCRVNPLAIGVGATPGPAPRNVPRPVDGRPFWGLLASSLALHATRDMLMRAAVAVAVGADSPGPWTNGRPCQDASGSGGAEVLVEKPAEAITALHRAGGDGDHICRWPGEALVEPLMGAGPVVVVDELRRHALQVPPAEDQEVVEALAPRCANKSLGHGVRPRRSIGQAHNLHAFRAEDLVECGRELGVPVSEQELLGSQLAVLQLPGQVARLLEHPGLVGAVGAAGQVNATAADLDEEEHVEPG